LRRIVVAAALLAAPAAADDAGVRANAASAGAPREGAAQPARADAGTPKRDAGASDAGVPDGGPVPAGHPAMPMDVEGDDDADMQDDPHAGARQGGAGQVPGTFQPPPDAEEEDEKLPVGTIVIDIRDAEDKPVPHAEVTLGILRQSIAKGESRERKFGSTSDAGAIRFDGLDTGSGLAYRVSVPKDGASFAARPFNMPAKHGMHVVLHVYAVSKEIPQLVVMQTLAYFELKDDRLQAEEVINVFNFGKVAWAPDGLIVPLPSGFTALTSQQQMSDQGVDPVEHEGARLRGTFAPGRHQVEFRWQLPYSGDKDVEFDLGMPPRTAAVRVMAAAAQQMHLNVEGFSPAQPSTDNQGNHILVVEREMHRDEVLQKVHVALNDIPTDGPARKIATGVAAVVVAFGLTYATQNRRRKAFGSPKAERQGLLAELEELERAHAEGEVGPKTYERARRDLIDAIARTLREEKTSASESKKKTPAA